MEMEDRRSRLGKSPATLIPIPTIQSQAFQMPSASSYMSRAKSTSNFVISPETEMVDLNVPHPLIAEVEGSPPRNNSQVSPLAVKSAPPATTTGRPLPTLEQVLEKEMSNGCDVKKLRRTISNRLSAQRSRMKKAQCIVEMEEKIKVLQDTISIINSQIEIYRNKQRASIFQKAKLEQLLDSAIIKSNLFNIQIEENKREVMRLKELQKQQMFASNFGKQQPPSFFNHHSQLFPGSGSGYIQRHEEPENTNTDPVVFDQYINFDAFNGLPNKN